MKHYLFGAIGIAILSVSACLCLTILDGRALVKAQFGVAQREGEKTRNLADRHAKQIEQDLRLRLDAVLTRVDAATNKADAQLTAIRETADAQLTGLSLKLEDAVNKGDAQITGLRAQIDPVLASSTHLLDTYAALPAQAAASPAWLALQPEITCRQLDGSGYGGCWHSRITGLMGEAVRVGGVFTQHFPSMVSSVDGIGVDIHTATHKFVAPTSTKTKIWDGFKSMALIASHF